MCCTPSPADRTVAILTVSSSTAQATSTVPPQLKKPTGGTVQEQLFASGEYPENQTYRECLKRPPNIGLLTKMFIACRTD
jgi:hypothetical protein